MFRRLLLIGLFFSLAVVPLSAQNFLRGDVDASGDVDAVLDAVSLLCWGFGTCDKPPCADAADIDDNGEVQSLIDAVFLLSFSFLAGPVPPSPGPDSCGMDPTDDALDCEVVAGQCL